MQPRNCQKIAIPKSFIRSFFCLLTWRGRNGFWLRRGGEAPSPSSSSSNKTIMITVLGCIPLISTAAYLGPPTPPLTPWTMNIISWVSAYCVSMATLAVSRVPYPSPPLSVSVQLFTRLPGLPESRRRQQSLWTVGAFVLCIQTGDWSLATLLLVFQVGYFHRLGSLQPPTNQPASQPGQA